jgi:hypothetical protein
MVLDRSVGAKERRSVGAKGKCEVRRVRKGRGVRGAKGADVPPLRSYALSLLRSFDLDAEDFFLDEALGGLRHDLSDRLPHDAIAEALQHARHHLLDHFLSDRDGRRPGRGLRFRRG